MSNHHERNGRIKKMYLIESWLEYRIIVCTFRFGKILFGYVISG